MKNIMASEFAANITAMVEQFGDAPIYATDDFPYINRLLPAIKENGERCFFFADEPED